MSIYDKKYQYMLCPTANPIALKVKKIMEERFFELFNRQLRFQ